MFNRKGHHQNTKIYYTNQEFCDNNIHKKVKLGKNSYGGTPGHIPNPEVKSVNAEST